MRHQLQFDGHFLAVQCVKELGRCLFSNPVPRPPSANVMKALKNCGPFTMAFAERPLLIVQVPEAEDLLKGRRVGNSEVERALGLSVSTLGECPVLLANHSKTWDPSDCFREIPKLACQFEDDDRFRSERSRVSPKLQAQVVTFQDLTEAIKLWAYANRSWLYRCWWRWRHVGWSAPSPVC